jgi:hypothetical protein
MTQRPRSVCTLEQPALRSLLGGAIWPQDEMRMHQDITLQVALQDYQFRNHGQGQFMSRRLGNNAFILRSTGNKPLLGAKSRVPTTRCTPATRTYRTYYILYSILRSIAGGGFAVQQGPFSAKPVEVDNATLNHRLGALPRSVRPSCSKPNQTRIEHLLAS